MPYNREDTSRRIRQKGEGYLMMPWIQALKKMSISTVKSIAGGEIMSGINQVNISVLGYREDDYWVALALEFDLLGHGDTPEEALNSLLGVVKAQIEFACEKNDPGLMDFPAEEKYFKLFDEARKSTFLSEIFSCKDDGVEERFSASVPVKDFTHGGFSLSHA